MTVSANTSPVCAIVVTYHPHPDCAARVAALADEGTPVILVDNGSSAAELAHLNAMAVKGSVELLRNGKNLGVATALNQGVTRAAERGFQWALLLDQDTRIERRAIEALLAMAQAYPQPDSLAIIGAGFTDPVQRTSAPLTPSSPQVPWDQVSSVITSGSLLSLAAYRRIGGFRDEFFIDYVDEEYCLRARRAGLHVLRSKADLIEHAVGAPTLGRFLWQRRWTTNHSAERRFYIARNDTVMLRESGRYPHGRWAWKSAARRLQTCKRIIMFEQQRTAKVVATARGWWAGVTGKMGPLRHR